MDIPLEQCSKSPNCVCSVYKEDQEHFIEAFSTKDSEIIQKLKEVILSLPRTKIIAADKKYLKAEFTTRIMRYVDDFEAFYDAENNLLHLRSASRIGYSDLGVNRKRVNSLKEKLQAFQ